MQETAKTIISTAQAFWSLFWSVSFVFGMVLTGYSIIKYIQAVGMRSTMLMQKGRMQKVAALSMIGGIFLVSLPAFIDVGGATIYGSIDYGEARELNYEPGGKLSGQASTYMKAVMYVLMTVGLFTALRSGWYLSQGQGWKFVRFYFYGIALIYIDSTARLLANTFPNTPVSQFINNIFG